MNRRLILKVVGKVQGVAYRYRAREKADVLDLTGWIRNESDGTVRITAEGSKDNLEEFIEWTKKGSSLAKVSDVVLEWDEYKGEFDEFEIRF